MTSINYLKVVNKLIEKTEKKEVNWLINRVDEFRVLFKSGAITISKLWNAEYDGYEFMLRIYNLNGDRIFDVSCTEVESNANPLMEIPFSTLDRLFKAAKTAHFKVEETVENIIDELDGNEEIGEKEDPNKEDLPF